MFESLLKFLARRNDAGPDTSAGEQFDRKQVAAAALLVEAAWLDSNFAEEERTAIVRLVGEYFHLAPDKAKKLLTYAERRQKEAYSGWEFIKAVREGFSPAEREEIVEMLWRVAYADGTLRAFERQMVARVGDELDLPAAAVEAARQRAAAG